MRTRFALVALLTLVLLAPASAKASGATVQVDNSLGNRIASGVVVNGDPGGARLRVTNQFNFWAAIDLMPAQGGAHLTSTNPLIDWGGIYSAGRLIGPHGTASYDGAFDPIVGGSQAVWVHLDLSTAGGAAALAGTVLQIIAGTFGDELVAPSSEVLSTTLTAIATLPDFVDFVQALQHLDVWTAVQHYELMLQSPSEARALSDALSALGVQLNPASFLAAATVKSLQDLASTLFDIVRAGIGQHTSGQVTFSLAPTPTPTATTVPSAPGAALPTVRIGSDDFYESKLIAEIYAQVLEHAGYTVDRHFGLGGRQTREPLLEAGQVDMVPEYIGSGLNYYQPSQATGDSSKTRDKLAAILKSRGIEVFGITPAQDQNAFVVRKETATSLNLSKMSDLAAVQNRLKWGLPADCDTNPICKGALVTYGITYPPKARVALNACDAPIAQALQTKSIDLAELCSTQPAIAQFGFLQLTDDKQTQPAENIAPLVRDDFLAKLSSADKTAFQALLDAASAKMDTATLTQLGVDIAVNNQDIAAVARAWLTQQGLLP